MSAMSGPRQAWFEANRANWDDRAAVHEASSAYDLDRLIADPAHIEPTVLQDAERLGDLHDCDVIHLQCHLGTDTISLARLGARRVVGVDLSGESLRRARLLAQRCGPSGERIDYVEANVYDARQAVTGDFDLVYTSVGVLCWLPDVAAWARVVASLMKPGGRFLIRDDHPMFMAVGEDVSNGLRIELPYFERAEPLTWSETTSYTETIEVARDPDAVDSSLRLTHTISHQWNHSIGEILTALLQAGLVIDSFEESQYSAWCPWPELMVEDDRGYRLKDDPDRLPLQFIVTAHRPE